MLKPGGRFVLVDSVQRGDRPDYDGLLDLFPRNYHEPYYSTYISEDFEDIAEASGLTHERSDIAYVGQTGCSADLLKIFGDVGRVVRLVII